jgi:hypothetical protein
VSISKSKSGPFRSWQKISTPPGCIFCQSLAFAGHSPFYAHETKHSILRLFRRIKKMSEMRIEILKKAMMKQNSACSHCRIKFQKKKEK